MEKMTIMMGWAFQFIILKADHKIKFHIRHDLLQSELFRFTVRYNPRIQFAVLIDASSYQ